MTSCHPQRCSVHVQKQSTIAAPSDNIVFAMLPTPGFFCGKQLYCLMSCDHELHVANECACTVAGKTPTMMTINDDNESDDDDDDDDNDDNNDDDDDVITL